MRHDRTAGPRTLPGPRTLREAFPLDRVAERTVTRGREKIRAVLGGHDDRLLVLVGPCSVHDPVAALEYAAELAGLAERLADRLVVVMRAYLEKPRTTIGWKGLLTDPGLDGGHDVESGLRISRSLLVDITGLGLPVGCEFLDPLAPPYLADAVSWGCVGARTAHSQVHRQLASGLPMPIGVKNAPDGDVRAAIEAVGAIAAPHVHLGVDDDGRISAVHTPGNPHGHVVLRGSTSGPNYDAATVAATADMLARAGRPEKVVVDASHGNSGKDHRRQPGVVHELADRIAAGEPALAGVMIESFLLDGRQDLGPGPLVHGRSVTDACVDLKTTTDLLHTLADAVALRRADRQLAV